MHSQSLMSSKAHIDVVNILHVFVPLEMQVSATRQELVSLITKNLLAKMDFLVALALKLLNNSPSVKCN